MARKPQPLRPVETGIIGVTVRERSLGDLIPDPDNVRKHNEHNIALIENSLQENGAWRSLAIDEDDVIRAGNGTAEAAGNVGIERVVEIEVPGDVIVAVKRTGLTNEQKRRYSVFDNQATDKSDFDPLGIARMEEEGICLAGIFTDFELDDLRSQAEAAERAEQNSSRLASMLEDGGGGEGGGGQGQGPARSGDNYKEQYGVIVMCRNEEEQEAVYERFQQEGYKCKVVTT